MSKASYKSLSDGQRRRRGGGKIYVLHNAKHFAQLLSNRKPAPGHSSEMNFKAINVTLMKSSELLPSRPPCRHRTTNIKYFPTFSHKAGISISLRRLRRQTKSLSFSYLLMFGPSLRPQTDSGGFSHVRTPTKSHFPFRRKIRTTFPRSSGENGLEPAQTKAQP